MIKNKFLNINRYRTKTNRLLFFMAADVIFIFLSVWIAFFLRFEGSIPSQYLTSILRTSVLSVFFIIPIFHLQGLYTFSWSFVSTKELISLLKALTLSFIFMIAVIFIPKDFYAFFGFPRSVLFISYFLIFLLSGSIRFAKRIYLSVSYGSNILGKKRTLIVGAGDTGEQILRSILSLADSPYFPVGFADDSHIKQNVAIHGVKVLGKVSDIPKIIKENQVSQLIIALPSAGSKAVRDAVELGRKSGIKKIKIFPPLSEIIKGNLSLESLKNVRIESLLGRDSVLLDTNQIEKLINNKKVLITGAAGSIGSELSRQIARFKPSSLLLLDQDETGIFNISEELTHNFSDLKIGSFVADIRDQEKINDIFSKFRPEIIFHAAAYKHVPLMEENPDEAVKNNIFGTEILAKASVANQAQKFIFISTDKAVNPSSVMGATKRIGEMICQVYNQKNNTKFISVRFGNVLDSRGSVIPIFREQIKRGGPVEVTHPEMRRYFMLNSEACLLVMQAGFMGQGGEVFVLDMGKPIKILDLAREMIRLSGFKPDKNIAIVFTNPRPGEKLFEDILTAEEGTAMTQNKKIFMAKIFIPDTDKFVQKIKKLNNFLINQKKYDLIEVLKEIVPFRRKINNY